MFGSYLMPFADSNIGDMINSVGAWIQVHIGVTTIRTLGVAATIYGFFMVFRAATSQQGRGGTRWMQAAVALIVGFGMIIAPSFYTDIGNTTSTSVQQAVTSNGKAGTSVGDGTIALGQTIQGSQGQSISIPQTVNHVAK